MMKPNVDTRRVLRVRRRDNGSRTLIVVPRSMVKEYINQAHSGDAAHPGVDGTLFALAQFAWWPTMRDDVVKSVRDCLSCQSFRRVPRNAKLGKPEAEVRRFEVLHMDWAPIVEAKSGETGVWVMVDAGTGFCYLVAASDKSSASAIRALERLIAVSGAVPQTVRTDNAKELTSAELIAFVQKNGMALDNGSSYNQRSNGVAENAVGRVKRELLLRCRNDRSAWPRRAGSKATSSATNSVRADRFKVTNIDWRNRRVKLLRVADGVALRKAVSINRIQTVSKEAVETKVEGVWAGAKDPSLLLDAQKVKVAENVQKEEDTKKAETEQQREKAVREEARVAARKAEAERRLAEDRRIEQGARVRSRDEAQSGDGRDTAGAQVQGWHYTADDGEVLDLQTESGKIEISKAHTQYRRFKKELDDKKEAERASNKARGEDGSKSNRSSGYARWRSSFQIRFAYNVI
jgi:hypothetical protein